jgi:hypothetical protein
LQLGKEEFVGAARVSFAPNSEEIALIAELLDSEQARLLVEIRHTDHRAYRDELRRRLDLVERLRQRWLVK